MKTTFAVLMLFLSGSNQVQLSHKIQSKGDGEHLTPDVLIDMEAELLDELDTAAHEHEAEVEHELEELDDEAGGPVPKEALRAAEQEAMAMLDWADAENKAQRDVEVAGLTEGEAAATDFAKRSEGKGDIEFAQTKSNAHRKLASRLAQIKARQPSNSMEACAEFRAAVKEAVRELEDPRFVEEMQGLEDAAEGEFHAPAPFPPAEEVDQALLAGLHEILNIPDFENGCSAFLDNVIHEVQKTIQQIHQQVAPNCQLDDPDCILGSVMGKVAEAEEQGAFAGLKNEVSALAGRSGHNVPPENVDEDFKKTEHDAEEFNNDVHMDDQANEWEKEGEQEAESDWEKWEQNRCPCGDGDFCNNDDGPGKGFCEPCGRHKDADSCFNDGLPKAGASECSKMCFGF